MKNLKLLKFLECLFTIFEILAAILIILLVLSFSFTTLPGGQTVLYRVGLQLDPAIYHLSSSTLKAQEMTIDHAVGAIRITNPDGHALLDAALKWPKFIS